MRAPLTELTLDEWQRLVETCSYATPFHHRNWIQLLAEQYRFPLTIPALVEGNAVAALPFMETRGLTGSRKLLSLPFTDCIRPIAAEGAHFAAFVAALRADDFHRGRPVVIKTDQPFGPQSQPGAWVRHELTLDKPAKDIVAAYPSTLRRNLRRAEKHGLRFERRNDPAAMEDFFRLHVLTRRKLGTPVQPKRYFKLLVDRVLQTGLGSIGMVLDRESVIAAAVFLEFNGSVIYKYGASDPATLDLRPNEYLFDHAIRLAHESGARHFDFGVTHLRDEGLCRFKRKWGAQETPVYYESIVGPPQDAPEESLATRLASAAIRHSPTIVCRALGEAFYRYSQ